MTISDAEKHLREWHARTKTDLSFEEFVQNVADFLSKKDDLSQHCHCARCRKFHGDCECFNQSN